MRRREFIAGLVGVATLPLVGHAQQQQAYPTRPVRFIIGYPPGGSADITAPGTRASMFRTIWHTTGHRSVEMPRALSVLAPYRQFAKRPLSGDPTAAAV
jgi:hypothetical protein